MTLTSHAHHIPGTPKVRRSTQPVNCGGPGVCDICTFEMRWYADRDKQRARLYPSEVDGLNSQILRRISAKLRSQNPKLKPTILVREQVLSRTIHALADAIDGVADDIGL